MAITVTPKYKPFTYDELVKPLGEYWKKYDAQEQALNTALEEVSSLDAHLSSLNPDIEGNKKYIEQVNSYKNSINALTEELVSEGFNTNQKKSATKLKQLYRSQIVPISNALVEMKKYEEKEREKENAGYVIGAGSTKNLTIADVIGGNVPEATSIMSLKSLEDEAAAITNRITSAMVEYEGANESQIKKGIHRGYTTTIGFDPKLLLTEGFGNNQKVKETYQGIQNQIKKYILASLNLTENEYNSLDRYTKDKIDAHIQQGIIRGVTYQQSIHQRPVSVGNGGGGRNSKSLYIQAFPITPNEVEISRLNSKLNDFVKALNEADAKIRATEGEEWTVTAIGGLKIDDYNYSSNVFNSIKDKAFYTDKKGSIPVTIVRDLGNDNWEEKTIYMDLPGEKKQSFGFSFNGAHITK